jgi:DNA-binding CsgD family transcriptional regulator
VTPYELAQALGGAHKEGPHWRARCPAHDDHHASLDIREGEKVPFIVSCRVCGNSREAQKRIVDALKSMGLWSSGSAPSGAVGPAPVREIAAEPEDTWKCVTPVPDGVPPLPNSNPSMRFTYRDAEGRVLCYTERLEKPGGGKDVKPFSWCVSKTGAKQWKRKGLSAPHPLYGLDRLAKYPDLPVLVCEGEKKADAGTRLLKSYVTVSWAGGSGRVRQADWTPLKGRKVIIWPDHRHRRSATPRCRPIPGQSTEALRGAPRQCVPRADKLSPRRDRTRQALHKPPASFITGYGDIPMSVSVMKAGRWNSLSALPRFKIFRTRFNKHLRATAARRHSKEIAELRKRFDALTSREREVMSLVVAGWLNKQIGFELKISEITVKIHRGGVMEKMGAPSLAELVRMTERLELPTVKDQSAKTR